MTRNLQSYLPSVLIPKIKEENTSYWFIRTISRSLKAFNFLCHQTAESIGGLCFNINNKFPNNLAKFVIL